MKTLAIIVGVIFLAGVLVAGCVALVNDEDSFGPIQLVSHQYDRGGYDDGGDCWDEYDCRGREYGDGDGYEQRYDQNYGSRDDRNRNRNRDRGAFSPGPFRDSPVEIWFCPQPNSCNQGDGGRGSSSDEEPQPQAS